PFVSLCSFSFVSTHPAPTAIYTLSLHDALPIFLVATSYRALVVPIIGRPRSDDGAAAPSRRSILRCFAAAARRAPRCLRPYVEADRKSTRLNSSHVKISYAVFCLKKKKQENTRT